jgi:hypothetical protein
MVPTLTQAEADVITAVGCEQREYLIGHEWEVAKLRRDGLLTGRGNLQLTKEGREAFDHLMIQRRS